MTLEEAKNIAEELETVKREDRTLEQHLENLMEDQKELIEEESELIEFIKENIIPCENDIERIVAKSKGDLSTEEHERLAEKAKKLLKMHLIVFKETKEISNQVSDENMDVSTIADLEADLDKKVARLEDAYFDLRYSEDYESSEANLYDLPSADDLKEELGIEVEGK